MEINIFPELLLAKLGVPSRARIHVALLLSALAALAAAPLLIRLPHICLMETVLGLPCPGCGVLHALTAVLRGHWVTAWRANPAGVAFAFVLGFQIVARPAAIARAPVGGFVSSISKQASRVVLGSLMAVWLLRLVNGGR